MAKKENDTDHYSLIGVDDMSASDCLLKKGFFVSLGSEML